MLQNLFAGTTFAQLAFLGIAAFVAGLARGFSGFGAALIFMSLASAIAGPRIAAPLLLVIDGFGALGMIPNAWRQAHKRDVAVMAAGAVIGVPMGAAFLAYADPFLVRWLIIVLVILLLMLLMSGWRYHGKPSDAITAVVGLVAGLFSGTAQAGGPPIVAYWLGGAIPFAIVRANIVLYFAVSTVFSVVSYAVGGLFVAAIVAPALTTGPLYLLGLNLGSRLFNRADERLFRRVCYGLIATAAILGLPLLDPVLR